MLFKRVVSFFLVPATRWYLRKPRGYTYNGVDIVVQPGVFHPGLFYSTKFLLEFLREQPLAGKSLLELGVWQRAHIGYVRHGRSEGHCRRS